jgi:hypothetical protein
LLPPRLSGSAAFLARNYIEPVALLLEVIQALFLRLVKK